MDNHCYDFERDSQLLTKLNEFLDTVKGKAMRRWVESIKKVIARKVAVFFLMNSNFSLNSFFSGPSDVLVTILDSHCVSQIS